MDSTTRQLVKALALGINALFAYILLEMVFRNRLHFYLNTDVFGWVVTIAGVLLGGMVALRAGAWVLAKAGVTPDVAHDCCGHDHSHDHGHDDHAHSHEVSLWRLIVVAFPLMMLMAGLVPTSLSASAIENKMSEQQKLAAGMKVASLPAGRKVEGARVVTSTMAELAMAARDPQQRAFWESTTDPLAAKVIGQLMRTRSPDRYQLQRQKITCCTNDATPMVILVAGTPNDEWRELDWLEVVGPVSYQRDPTGGYTAVIHQVSAAKTIAPADIYLK